MSSKPHDDSGNGGDNQPNQETDIDDGVDAQELLDLYLGEKESGMKGQTRRSHKSRLSFFVEWFEDETDYATVDEVSRKDILKFKQWRFTDHAVMTVKTQMDTLRQLLVFAENNGLMQQDVHVAAESPKTEDEDDVAHRAVDPDRVKRILDYLHKYEYGQRKTVELGLAWETAMRRSSLQALDIGDFNAEEGYISVQNRPEQGTRLKNGSDGERYIALRDETIELIQAWIDGPRPDVTDEYGRRPLFATENGRISEGCLQMDIYQVLKPSYIGEECSCNPANGEDCHSPIKSDSYECEDSEGPHAIRSTAITYHLNQGWPIDRVSDRVNCKPKTIRKHYDEASKHEQMERRSDLLDKL